MRSNWGYGDSILNFLSHSPALTQRPQFSKPAAPAPQPTAPSVPIYAMAPPPARDAPNKYTIAIAGKI